MRSAAYFWTILHNDLPVILEEDRPDQSSQTFGSYALLDGFFWGIQARFGCELTEALLRAWPTSQMSLKGALL